VNSANRSNIPKADKWALIRIILLVVFSGVILLNSMTLTSPFIGIPSSLGILFISSLATGEIFFPSEKKFLRQMLGLATFIVIMALLGAFLMLMASFNESLSLISVLGVNLVLCLLSLRKRLYVSSIPEQSKEKKRRRKASYLFILPFLLWTAIAFYALLMARTGEGVASVWLTIPFFFLPVFTLSSLSLVIMLLLAEIHDGLKLALISLYSFLSHSLFLIVWYPGRYGDPWLHLGEARFIDSTGASYAYAYVLRNLYIVDIIGSKAQYALVVLFRRLFLVDIYWVHVLFVPLLWSIFVPLFSFKIAQLLIVKKTRAFPLLAAISSNLFQWLIYWGTISVPNSSAFLFLFFLILSLLYWIDTTQRRFLLLSFLVSVVTFFAHPVTGIFAFIFFLGAAVVRLNVPKIAKAISYLLILLLYPSALLFRGATFSPLRLIDIENLLSLQSVLLTIPTVFAVVGLLFSIKGKNVRTKSVGVLFLFYITVIASYYVTTFGMENLPAGTDITRFVPMVDLLSVPFVALGFLSTLNVVMRRLSRVTLYVPKKANTSSISRLTSIFLISLFLAAQAPVALYQAYPQSEIMTVQPAAYEIDAVRFINSIQGRYVVLCDTNFAGMAIAFLGTEYGYGGGARGMFGIPEWEWWTIESYLQMARSPSVSVMENAMAKANAERCYFVVSIRNPDFDEIVERSSEVLPVDKVFGDGKLYVYSYPTPLVEGVGPLVGVTFDNGTSSSIQTRSAYISRSEVYYSLTLSGSSSYNVTDYPIHWSFRNLTVNNLSTLLNASSDINNFIYETGLEPSDVLTLTWQANDIYTVAGWKEDSFKSDWQTSPFYEGTITPQIGTDGNTLSLSWAFVPGSHQYYYYTKSVAISTNRYPYILVKWRSTGPVAVVAVAYKGSEALQEPVVPFNSESGGWIVTVVPLQPDKETAYVMVGITNLLDQNIAGSQGVFVDFILICAK
jgi:hypothetical protein